ncbi:hypothetical protein CONLIGDRAFT_266876 [Coniochaeta ligniaria NRRL 30616]|uniref:Uncharacterized protein n=1 Tax=Coniochaeta ligniaria NRRL 30616 TaxID=1408157 RepID=A0A1J7IYW4_9PEZI|nr:hypothetical protein CONLIGDRAFT_266876 [Coniochaeta ligniaria NRRL 30616]
MNALQHGRYGHGDTGSEKYYGLNDAYRTGDNGRVSKDDGSTTAADLSSLSTPVIVCMFVLILTGSIASAIPTRDCRSGSKVWSFLITLGTEGWSQTGTRT